MRRALSTTALAILLAGCGGAADPTASTAGMTAGQTYYGSAFYVEYSAGDLPIVLSAPHGGDLAPPDIPDRVAARCPDDDFSTLNDANTLALARLVRDSLHARTGRHAHLVVSRLARRKLDANRDSAAASCGDATAGRAWHEYHAFIDSAEATVGRASARGLYVDLHGHAHAIARAELGYLLRGSQLDASDAQVELLERSSSLRTLSEQSPLSFAALLRGPSSVGGLLEARGYASVPSPSAPGPAGAPYFDGGYDTLRHGCRDGGRVCGVQIELPFDGVRDTDADRQRFAGALTSVLLEFARTQLGATLVVR